MAAGMPIGPSRMIWILPAIETMVYVRDQREAKKLMVRYGIDTPGILYIGIRSLGGVRGRVTM